MKYFSLRLVPGLVFMLVASAAAGQDKESTSAQQGRPSNHPYIHVDVNVELRSLRDAVDDMADASQSLAQSLEDLGAHEDLGEEQQQQITTLLERVDDIAQSLQHSVTALPQAVEQTSEPILGMASELSRDVKQVIMLVALVLVLIVAGTILAFYRFMVMPLRRIMVDTSENLRIIAQSLQHTMEYVEQAKLSVKQEVTDVQKPGNKQQ